jgi:hypothetical protein
MFWGSRMTCGCKHEWDVLAKVGNAELNKKKIIIRTRRKNLIFHLTDFQHVDVSLLFQIKNLLFVKSF